jgi:hypothetical protein
MHSHLFLLNANILPRSDANYNLRPAIQWMIDECPALADIYMCKDHLADTNLRLWRKEKQKVYNRIASVADCVSTLHCYSDLY